MNIYSSSARCKRIYIRTYTLHWKKYDEICYLEYCSYICERYSRYGKKERLHCYAGTVGKICQSIGTSCPNCYYALFGKAENVLGIFTKNFPLPKQPYHSTWKSWKMQDLYKERLKRLKWNTVSTERIGNWLVNSLRSFSGNVSVNRGSVADNPLFLILMFVVLRITFNIINL